MTLGDDIRRMRERSNAHMGSMTDEARNAAQLWAKNYTDNIKTAVQGYVDGHIDTIKTYIDNQITATRLVAKNYTDSKIAAAINKLATDNNLTNNP